MSSAQIKGEYLWSSLQEPVCASKFPSAYLRLLSALDNDWQIVDVELRPTWDQTGFAYQVVLQQKFQHRIEELILPKNRLVDEVLERYELVPCA